jgi:Flp pilus assembly pilin Flp
MLRDRPVRRRLFGDRRGVAAAEFAMVATVLAIFVVAIVDIGGAIQQRMVLTQAARAVGQYAMSFPTQSAGIASALTHALPATWTDVVPNVTMCICADGNQPSSCGSVCSSGEGGYYVLTLKRPYSDFLIPTGNCGDGSQANCVSYVVRFQ